MALNTNAKLSDVITSLSESQGMNQKAELASVIGSPATASDNVATQITKLQTVKNTLAEKMGVENTTPLQSMADSLVVGKKWASGSTTSLWNGASDQITVTNLNFKPSLVVAQNNNGNWYNTVIAFRNSGLPFSFHYNKNGTKTELGAIELEDGTSESETMYLSNATNNVQFKDNGFVIPAINSNSVYSWIAYE